MIDALGQDAMQNVLEQWHMRMQQNQWVRCPICGSEDCHGSECLAEMFPDEEFPAKQQRRGINGQGGQSGTRASGVQQPSPEALKGANDGTD